SNKSFDHTWGGASDRPGDASRGVREIGIRRIGRVNLHIVATARGKISQFDLLMCSGRGVPSFNIIGSNVRGGVLRQIGDDVRVAPHGVDPRSLVPPTDGDFPSSREREGGPRSSP